MTVGNDKGLLLVGTPRSGSTALAKLLESVEEFEVAVEPEPNFNIECGIVRILNGAAATKGKLSEVVEQLRKRINTVGSKRLYVEKSVSMGPFLAEFANLVEGLKVVYLHRDGRDVVKSCFNWHRSKFGNFFRENGYDMRGSAEMRWFLWGLQIERDTNDFSRPRSSDWIQGLFDDPLESRFRALAAMWENLNREYAEQLEAYEPHTICRFSSTRADRGSVGMLEEFCEGRFTEAATQRFIGGGGNSVADRGFTSDFAEFPPWAEWGSRFRDLFEMEAEGEMVRLGYWPQGEKRRFWKTDDYGRFWEAKSADVEWFEWMYGSRIAAHKDLEKFVWERRNGGDVLGRVAEIGPGLGVGYRDFFEDSVYHGFEVTASCVDWFNREYGNENRLLIQGDILEISGESYRNTYDLVYSQGTIDNCYDVDQYLLAMCGMSRKWVYVTCYRGWFPYLEEHRYSYNEEQGCFYNDISPDRVCRILRESGYSNEKIWVEALATPNGAVPFETRILIDVS